MLSIINIYKSLPKKLVEKQMKKREFLRIINRLKQVFHLTGVSFSQNYEDLVFSRLVTKEKGVYLDIGAHNPILYSNTYQLYLKGWNGINIDPLPGCMDSFNECRPRDINLNIGVSSTPGSIDYFCFNEPAYNTTNPERAAYCISNSYSTLKEKISIKVDTLENILDHYGKDKQIDLLTIDVETRELDVLKSNNWEKYRPKIIIMETLGSKEERIEKLSDDPAVKFLLENDYYVVAKVSVSVFLADARDEGVRCVQET